MNLTTRRSSGSTALASCLLLAACSVVPSVSPSHSPQPAASIVASPAQSNAVTPGATAPARTASGGLLTLTGGVFSGADKPVRSFTVSAPAGWWASTFILSRADPVVAGMSIWLVGDVPMDPCHWKGTFVTPGPTVDDLVEVLVAQRLRDASIPVDVTLAGYSGKYLEWSVPADMVVTGDADFQGCDATEEGHTDFVSWYGKVAHSRYHQVAGQVDRLWILDVDGQTLVVDASYGPDTPVQVREQLAAIVETLELPAP